MPLTYLCETVWITRGSNSQLRFVWQEWDGQCSQLLGEEAEVRRLARKLEDTEPAAVIEEEAGQIFTALRTLATRSQRAELALRWFEAGITWRARWGDDDEGPQPDAEELIKELMDFWDIEKQVTRGHAYFAERTSAPSRRPCCAA